MTYDIWLSKRSIRPKLGKIERVIELVEHQPVFLHARSQNAMVRSNGGLRGSQATATRSK